jgi:hypothetical protein
MRVNVEGFRPRARAQAEELLQAIEAAEHIIVSTIERECEALRAGRALAAMALRTRLRDAAKLYLNASRAARASVWTLEQILPGICDRLEERRAAFASLLKVELAILATERAAASDTGLDFTPAAEMPAVATVSAKRQQETPRAPVLAVIEEPTPPRPARGRAARRQAG